MVRPAGAPDNTKFEDDNYIVSINDAEGLRVSTTDAVLASTLNSASLSYIVLSGANARTGTSGATVAVQISASQHFVLASSETANIGFGLPPASASIGQLYTIKKISPDSNLVFLSGFATTEKVDGHPFATLTQPSASISVISDGAMWHIVAAYSGAMTPAV